MHTSNPMNSVATMMVDVQGTRVHPGDRLTTSHNGEVQVKACLAPDARGQGALVRCTDGKGNRVDLRLLLSRATLIRETSSRR